MITANKIQKRDEIWLYSNPKTVQSNANNIYGNDTIIYRSSKPDKKYMVLNPETKKFIHFGQMGFEDFTKHNDKEKQKRFLKRNYKWENNSPYSASHLSYHLLW